MKRKTKFVVFSFICLSTMVLAGCGGGAHTHTFVEHEAKSATCTTAGNQKYFTCSAESCKDKIFNENKEETTAQAISIPALGHSYGEAVITWQGAVAHAEATCSRCSVKLEESKTGTFVTDSVGTCVEKEKGHYHVVFDNEHFGSADSGVVEREYGPHHLHKVDGQAETCEAPGFLAHYECDVAGCSKMFADEAATDEITDLDAWKAGAGKIAPHPHTVSKVSGKAPSCTEAGYKEAWVCSECGNYFEEEAATTKIGNKAAYDAWVLAGGKLNPTPHDTEKVLGQPETCTADGWKDYFKCKDCKALFEDEAGTTPIADLEAWKVGAGKIAKHAHHDATEVPGEAATCTADGFKSAWTCGECGQYFSDVSLAENKLIGNKAAYDAWVLNEGKIPAHGHDGEKVPGVAHDRCVADGYKDAWKCKYADCGLYFSDSTCDTLIGNDDDYAAWKVDPDGGLDPKDAHTPDGNVTPQVDPVRENTGKKAFQHCSVCECLLDTEGNETTDEALVIPAPAKHFEAATNMSFDFDEPIALTETITLDIKFINPVEGSHINVALLAEKEGGGSDWDNYLGYFEICQDSVASNNGVSVDTITDDGYLRVTFDLDQIDRVNHEKPAVPTFDAINGLFVRGNWSNVEGYVELNSTVKDHEGFTDWIEQVDPYHDVAGVKAHYECTGCDHHFDANYKMFDSTIVPSAFHYDPTHDPTLFYGALPAPAALDHKIALFDVKFDNPDTHQEVGFSMYDGSWAEHTSVYWLDCDSNGVYFEGTYDGISVHMMEDGYYRVFADLAKINPKNCEKITHLYIQYPNTVENRGCGYLDVLPTYDDADKVSYGALYTQGIQKDVITYIDPVPCTGSIYVDVKFLNPSTEDKLTMYFYQDENNYYGSYAISPNDSISDMKNIYDLGNGYYRIAFSLADQTWRKNGSPTQINYVVINGKYSGGTALFAIGGNSLEHVFKGGTDCSNVVGTNNVFVETDTINLDVKFDSPAESSKISFRLDQDDNNYIFNYDLTPSLKTGDQAGVTVTDLGNGIIRYSFKLSDLTHTKTGNPTVINKVRIRGAWSTGFGYYSVSVEKENNWQELKKGDFVDTPEIFEGDEMSGKAISFNFKLEGSETLTHSDYVNLALANDDGGKWLNVSGEIDLFGDFTTNKGGTVTSLGDGWYKLVIDSSKFNGDGQVTSYVNKVLINNVVGNITRVIIDWDSFDFIDFTRDFTQTGTMMRSFEPIDDWKTSDAILEFEYSEIAGSYGGHRNIICVVDKDGHYVGAFAFRDNTHVVNHWNGSTEGSALENSSVTKKEGTEDVYVVRVALKDLNVLNTYTGEESITKIDFANYFSSFRVYSMSIVR